MPPETQTGANTFGCYVNQELFVAPGGPIRQLGMPLLYADYGTKSNLLEISAYGQNGNVYLQILHPKETVNTYFIVLCTINGHSYEGRNFFPVCDSAMSNCSFVESNLDIGKINIIKFDTVNKIVSGNFYCKMGKYENGLSEDINNYILDSIANISQGRFDIPLHISPSW